MNFPYISRKYTYCPPALGRMPDTSAFVKAPIRVTTPAPSQTRRSMPGAPSSVDIVADFLNMPEPIIEPITTVTAVKRPSFCNSEG